MQPLGSAGLCAVWRGLPIFTGVYIGPGDTEDSEMMAVVGADTPERVQELLLAVPAKP